jgi:phage terminase small subunit
MPENGKSLTPKQQAFAQHYVETGNAAAAYRKAYTVSDTTKPTSIWVNASKVLASTKVALRVKELQAEHAKRHEVTVDTLTSELDDALALAKENKQASAAVQAIMSKAKLHGLIVEKAEVKARNYVVSDTPAGRDQLEEKPRAPMTEKEWMEEYGDPGGSTTRPERRRQNPNFCYLRRYLSRFTVLAHYR